MESYKKDWSCYIGGFYVLTGIITLAFTITGIAMDHQFVLGNGFQFAIMVIIPTLHIWNIIQE